MKLQTPQGLLPGHLAQLAVLFKNSGAVYMDAAKAAELSSLVRALR
jgi:hypothetical protein